MVVTVINSLIFTQLTQTERILSV